jgi:hypothetical protein
MVGAWGLAEGCTPSAASYCNKTCDCTGCTQSQRENCPGQIDSARKTAEDKGCGSEFNAAFSCVADGQCVNDKFDTGGCESEITDLAKCGVSVGNIDACTLFANDLYAKYEECGVSVSMSGSGGTSATCTDAAAKQATCLDACLSKADCNCLKNPAGSTCATDQKPFNDCAAACLK